MPSLHELFFGLFSTLTATVQLGYSSPVAETEATKIGVLEPKADDRHKCGIFSSIAWHSFSGGSCRRVARLAGSFGRYANPARSAHPDWRQGARNHKPHQRSRTMHTNQTSVPTSLAQLKAQLAVIALIVHANRCGVAK